MLRMKWVGLSVIVLGLELVGCTSYPIRASLDFHDTAALDGVREIAVVTKNGTIDVYGAPDRSDVDIQGKKFSTGVSLEDAKSDAEKIVIDISRDPARPEVLRIEARYPDRDPRRNRGASFVIALPPGPSVSLKTSNGKVKVTEVKGDVDVNTSNGEVRLEKVAGRAQVETSNGAIHVSDVEGDVDLDSSNGAIEMLRLRGTKIAAKTSNGHIEADDVHGNAVLRTSNSSIDFRASSLPARPNIVATTSNGRVRIEVPATVKANLKMHTSNGAIKTSFKNASVANLESDKQRLTASLNGGGGLIEMESSNGSLTFRTAEAGKP